MSLREVKALARSPQPNWVFNSSKVIPNRVSEVVLPSSFLVPERMVAVKNSDEKYFNGFFGEKIMHQGIQADEVSDGLLSQNGKAVSVGHAPVNTTYMD